MAEDRLLWLYERKLEEWRRACQDEWNWGLMAAIRGLNQAAEQRGYVASGEWEFDRWFTSAHLFLICVRHVWRFSSLLGDVLESAEIREAVAPFEARLPHAKDMRDFLEHFDDYARGAGRKQTGLPRPEELGSISVDENEGTMSYWFGGISVDLREALLGSMEVSRISLQVARRARGAND